MYYEIQGTSVRLLGSLHMFPAASSGMPAWCADAFEWAEHICIEHKGEEFLPHTTLQPGISLSEILPSDSFEMLDKWWGHGRTAVPLERYKPWAALIVLPATRLNRRPGVEELVRTRRHDKSFGFLESGDRLAASFDQIPLDSVCRSIEIAKITVHVMEENFRRCYELWAAQDLDGLTAYNRYGPITDVVEFNRAMFLDRNASWVDQIIGGFVSDSLRTLVVVGALHLGGEGGLLEGLAARGYPTKCVAPTSA